jgi:hypothetical protein
LVEITNRKELEAWLKGQPIEVSALIAARSALRVAPVLVDLFARKAASDSFVILSPSLRAMLKAAVAGTRPTAALKRAANAANAATDAAAWDSLNADIRRVEAGAPLADIRQSPLWSADVPDAINAQWTALNDILKQNPAFAFWRRWYQSVLDGGPQNWEMLQEIVLIDKKIWKAGPEAVAGKIAEIEADFLNGAASLAEAVEFDEQTAKFRSIPIEIAKPNLLAATLSQVQDALDDALFLSSNGLTERSRETRVLHRTLSRYANDPQRIEMDFTSVAVGLRRQIEETQDLPKSEDNLALLSAVEDGVRGIRETHPGVAENRNILARAALKDLSEDDREHLRAATPLLVEFSEGVMSDDYQADIPALTGDATDPFDGAAPPLDGVTRDTHGLLPAVRTFSRIAKTYMLIRKTPDIILRIDGSAGYKGARILVTLAGLISIGLALFGVL